MTDFGGTKGVFASIAKSCYSRGINTSYLGIVTRQGLQTLVRENGLALRRLPVLAADENGVCCWAVMPDVVGDEVQQLIATGETDGAWRVLNAVALHGGPVWWESFRSEAQRRSA